MPRGNCLEWQRPDPPSVEPLRPNYYCTATAIAQRACGKVAYEVVAPLTEAQAKAPRPEGPTSTEYAPPSRINNRFEIYHPEYNAYGRRVFNPDENLAFLRQSAEAREKDEQEARRQMGDFADDEHSEPLDTEGEED